MNGVCAPTLAQSVFFLLFFSWITDAVLSTWINNIDEVPPGWVSGDYRVIKLLLLLVYNTAVTETKAKNMKFSFHR